MLSLSRIYSRDIVKRLFSSAHMVARRQSAFPSSRRHTQFIFRELVCVIECHNFHFHQFIPLKKKRYHGSFASILLAVTPGKIIDLVLFLLLFGLESMTLLERNSTWKRISFSHHVVLLCHEWGFFFHQKNLISFSMTSFFQHREMAVRKRDYKCAI